MKQAKSERPCCVQMGSALFEILISMLITGLGISTVVGGYLRAAVVLIANATPARSHFQQ